jgi:hypothetical protein
MVHRHLALKLHFDVEALSSPRRLPVEDTGATDETGPITCSMFIAQTSNPNHSSRARRGRMALSGTDIENEEWHLNATSFENLGENSCPQNASLVESIQ